MATRTATSTVLIVLLLFIASPLWLGLGAGIFGLVIGLFGAIAGVIAGIFGLMVSIILLPFRFIFGCGHYGWQGFPHFHVNGVVVVGLIILIALKLGKKK